MIARDAVKNKFDPEADKRQRSFITPEIKILCSSLELHCSFQLTLYIHLYTKKCSRKFSKNIFF